jgi:outer membrane biosynthesis protein TonB
MRKLILITAIVLASASAQAGERSLSLGGAESLPAAASNTVNASGKVADVPVTPTVEAPKPPETPKYVERPAVAAPAPAPQPQAQPAVQQANVQPASTPAAKPAEQKQVTAHKSSNRRHARYWTEGRIIGELHRHGIYW